MSAPPVTPDSRYIVVRGRLWRRSDPDLSPEIRQVYVDTLMAARRAVRTALASGDAAALAAARQGPCRQGRAGRARPRLVDRRRARPHPAPGQDHALCRLVRGPRRRLARPRAAPYPDAMPARSRPTARLLTPAGWAGLAPVAALACAAVLTFVLVRPHLV